MIVPSSPKAALEQLAAYQAQSGDSRDCAHNLP
jgi:hypothetical protein